MPQPRKPDSRRNIRRQKGYSRLKKMIQTACSLLSVQSTRRAEENRFASILLPRNEAIVQEILTRESTEDDHALSADDQAALDVTCNEALTEASITLQVPTDEDIQPRNSTLTDKGSFSRVVDDVTSITNDKEEIVNNTLFVELPADEDIQLPDSTLTAEGSFSRVVDDVTSITNDEEEIVNNILFMELPAEEDILTPLNIFSDMNISSESNVVSDLDASTEPSTLTVQDLDISGNTSLRSGIYKVPHDNTFSVVAMDLVLSPDKNVSKAPSCSLTREMKIAEAFFEAEQKGPEQAAEDFLMEVKHKVSSVLPKHWVCVTDGDNIKVLKFPATSEVLVQCELSVSHEGQISLKIHGNNLASNHELWSLCPTYDPAPCSSVEGLSKFVVALVGFLRGYEVCSGIPEECFAEFAKRLKGRMVFDDNRFQEARYNTTYRDVKCWTLVRTRQKQCGSCSALKGSLRRRLKRLPMGMPNGRMNDRYLNSAQKEKKLTHERKEKRKLQHSHSYYVKKAQSLLANANKTVEVDEGLAKDFSSIIEKQKQQGNLNPLQEIFFEEQLKYAELDDKRGMRWHPMMIRLGLRIQQLTSDKVLDAINDDGIIRLPSSRTLFNYSHYHSIKPGLDTPVINKLHEEMQQYAEAAGTLHQRYHVLMMDEMTISENLVQSHSTGELVGFVDLPPVAESVRDLKTAIRSIDVGLADEDTSTEPSALKKNPKPRTTATKGTDMKPALATKMLTYMVKGVASDQKRVVAAYGVDVLDVNDLFRKTWNVVRELEGADVRVLGIVCDGLSVNRRFIKMHRPFSKETEFHTVFDTVNCYGGGRPLFFFSDVPHLLKTIRNAFSSSGEEAGYSRLLFKNNQFICWKTIVDLYEAERYNHIRMAYKLNKQVVQLNNFSRMRVGYAAAVMSKTVANALRQMGTENISETITFIEKVNDFFDCLNGAHSSNAKRKRNPLLGAYTLGTKETRFEVLREFLQYLKDWKKECDALEGEKKDTNKAFLPTETFTGIDMTVHAFIGAINYLLGQEVKAKFIMARVFNQDPLEQFFSVVRLRQGGSRQPNEAQFLAAAHKFEMTRHLGFRTRGNTKCYKEEKNIAELCKPLPRLKDSRPKKRKVRRSLCLENIDPCTPSASVCDTESIDPCSHSVSRQQARRDPLHTKILDSGQHTPQESFHVDGTKS